MELTNSVFKSFQREFVRSVRNVRLLAYETDTIFALTDFEDDVLDEYKWNKEWTNNLQKLVPQPLCVLDILIDNNEVLRYGIVVRYETTLVLIQVEISDDHIYSHAIGYPTNQVLQLPHIKLIMDQVKTVFIENILKEDPKYRLLFATGILKEA